MFSLMAGFLDRLKGFVGISEEKKEEMPFATLQELEEVQARFSELPVTRGESDKRANAANALLDVASSAKDYWAAKHALHKAKMESVQRGKGLRVPKKLETAERANQLATKEAIKALMRSMNRWKTAEYNATFESVRGLMASVIVKLATEVKVPKPTIAKFLE